MKPCFLISIVISLNLTCYVKSSHICYGVDEEVQKDRFGTKTGYFPAFKNDSYLPQYENEVSGCTAEQVWFLTRHGTRYPIGSDFSLLSLLNRISREIVGNHLQGRGCLTENTVKELDVWFPAFSSRDKGQLQDTGYDELFSIGDHWKSMFPHIMRGPYNPSDFKIEFTIKNRTGQSAYHFLRGVFGDDAVGKIELPQPYSPNFLLRFYESCPRWIQEVYKNNETTYKERILFEKGEEFQSVIHSLSARLGYMHPLQAVEVMAIYEECRYETAWWPDKNSPWCEPFSRHDIEVLEYHQDLKYYYEDSYGNELNGKIACKTVSDLYKHFKATITTGISQPRAILYFSHDKSLLKVLTALNLFQPVEDLRHNNFDSMMDRPFRTSVIATFANNIGFTLYRCGEEYKVGTFYQGFPIPLEGQCGGKLLCSWEEISTFLKPIYSNCELGELCMLHDEL